MRAGANGTTTPVGDPNNPTGGTCHNWGNADRFPRVEESGGARTEYCSNATFVGVPGCATTTDMNTLRAVAYNELSAAYYDAFGLKGLMLQAGVDKLFGVNRRSATA